MKSPVVGSFIGKGLSAFCLLVSLIFWGTVVINNPRDTATLEEHYTDHLRHQLYARFLIDSGFDLFAVYRTPLRDLPPLEEQGLGSWPDLSYPYPLGILVFYLPFAALSQSGMADMPLVNKSLVLVFLTLAHLDVYLFFKAIWASSHQELDFIAVVTTLMFYLLLVFWSLNGQYEAVPLLFLILAASYYRTRRYNRAMAALAVAFLLKYQALLYLPVLGMIWWQGWNRLGDGREAPYQKKGLGSVWGSLLIGGAFGLDFLTVYSSSSYVMPPGWQANPISYRGLLEGGVSWGLAGSVAALTMSLFIYFLVTRDYLAGAEVAFATGVLSALSLLQSWYAVWLFPFPLFSYGRTRSALCFWVLALVYLLGWQLNYPDVVSTVVSIQHLLPP